MGSCRKFLFVVRQVLTNEEEDYCYGGGGGAKPINVD